jgi:V/A-type H+-transporting ATPase subunit E
MSLNKVVEEILRKGEEKKKDAIRLGEKERDEQVLLADKRIEERRGSDEQRAAAFLAQMEQQELSSAELESKKMLLSTQRLVMEGLKQEVLAELERYPSDKRKKLYATLVAKAKKELGDCYVYSSARDKPNIKLISGMLDGGTIDSRGGLVFESKDRSVRLDYRFEGVLEDIWNKNMYEIYKRLFG